MIIQAACQMTARLLTITGHVQGVFFRAWTRDKARELGISGWVRNCADGSVEAHLEGDESKVRWLIDLIGDGPPGSRVDNVRSIVAEPQGLGSFEVRR